ncbi:hypothetical protein ACFY9F_12710 [Streptomyces sp. NPDC012421]|uniref:hypothetical protein n=1 Tax=Streptomyces sp. NPDC012421 TaxID=3364832 RepID=UPI0036EFCD80
MTTTPALDTAKPAPALHDHPDRHPDRHPDQPGKPAQPTGRPGAPGPRPDYASRSVPRHLARGAVGFGLIAGSLALLPVTGPVSLLAAPLALIAFRGCPTCWAVGLAQTISRGRLERRCADGVCTLTPAGPRPAGTPRR